MSHEKNLFPEKKEQRDSKIDNEIMKPRLRCLKASQNTKPDIIFLEDNCNHCVNIEKYNRKQRRMGVFLVLLKVREAVTRKVNAVVGVCIMIGYCRCFFPAALAIPNR